MVWAVELFKNDKYGVSFGVVSETKALQRVLKANIGDTIVSRRLTRWADRLLPFNFSVEDELSRTLGLAEHLSHLLSYYESSSVKVEETSTVVSL